MSVEGSRQYVLFRLGTEEYGLPIDRVSSIIRYERPTPVPHAPAVVDGVINLRGQVIPVVNLGRKLFGKEFEASSASRIVVAEGEIGQVGLAVDAASEVATIPLEDVRPTPETALAPETAEAFDGVANREDKLIILLNLDKAVPRSEYGAVAGGEGAGDDQ